MGTLGGSSAWSTSQAGNPNVSGSLGLFQSYRLADGSGSQFAGLAAGYGLSLKPRVILGAEADISFGAEPVIGAAAYNDMPLVSGTARGRIGYLSRHGFYYATGGLAWTHDLFSTDRAETSFERVGLGLGGGVEAPLTSRWTAKAEYLYSRFGNTDVALPDGSRFLSDLSLHQVRVGLTYRLINGPGLKDGFNALGDAGKEPREDDAPGEPRGTIGIVPLNSGHWSVHAQTTYVSQYAPPFRAPYAGPNSLASNSGRETWDATLYAGRRLWKGGEVWFNPEIDQGFGLSNTLGVAGFTSGEAYKVGHKHPYWRVPRAFVRQTLDLGGETEKVESGINQFEGSQSANRIVMTAGKFSVSDLFDTITYAHDPRNDFLNWALADSGTFDYAADAWGFTYGAALEWYQGRWTARAGLFDLSIVPNSVELDHQFGQYQIVYELEHRHALNGQPGKLALVGYVSRGRMGRFDDAVAFAQQMGTTPNTADVRRYESRPGVNVNAEQRLLDDVAIFGRVGWANGDFETYEFTDIDRTWSVGLSSGGKRWGRRDDTVGVSTIFNSATDAHLAYFNAGGLGVLVGDGQLPHPGTEQIIEAYYRLPLGSLQVTADYQLIGNPGYNRDRGPVSVISLRLRTQF